MLATNPKRGYQLPWYRGELLALARDLGRRLLPAFNTPTGIPYPRIHLQHGELFFRPRKWTGADPACAF